MLVVFSYQRCEGRVSEEGTASKVVNYSKSLSSIQDTIAIACTHELTLLSLFGFLPT
jgi:hypothetical protein